MKVGILDLWIVDSGGTKADWLGLDRQLPPKEIRGGGLNPNIIGWEVIRGRLANLVPQLSPHTTKQIFFFGAGLGTLKDRNRS